MVLNADTLTAKSASHTEAVTSFDPVLYLYTLVTAPSEEARLVLRSTTFDDKETTVTLKNKLTEREEREKKNKLK